MAELDKLVADTKVDQPDQKQTPEYTPDEQKAMSEGWKPKDQWEGAEDEWKPAKVFLEIGELKNKLQSADQDRKKLNKVVALMKDHHLQVRQAAYEEALKTLREERKAALASEDFAKAEELRDRIDDIRDRKVNDRVLPPDVQRKVDEQAHEPDPAFFEFLDRNPWYKPAGPNTRQDEMSKEADALGFAVAQQNPDWDFKTVITEVEKKIRKLYPEKFATPRSPVNEGGSRGSGSSGTKETVRLSEEQLAVAKSFNMTPEQYAKELKSYKGA